MAKGRRTRADVEPPPKCASCGDLAAAGSLFLTFTPYDTKPPPLRDRYDTTPRMDRGWSLHLPLCAVCMRACVKVNVKLDLKQDAANTWGHVDREKT